MIAGQDKRLPYPIDVTCNRGHINDLIPSFNFIVILNGFTFGFSEVSGLDKDMSADDIREGGNIYPVFTRKYECNFEQITLTKGLLIRKADYGSDTVRTALSQAALLNNSISRKAAVISAASCDPITTLEQGPAYGFLQVFDRKYKTALVSFSFFSYGASRWDVTNLNAQSNDFIYENITLVCSDLKRLPNSALPSRIWEKKFFEDQGNHNYYELTKKQKKDHKDTYTKDKEDENTNETKNYVIIRYAKKNDKKIQEDKQNRIKAFQKWKESIKSERKEEAEDLKQQLENNDKLIIDKMVPEIQKIDKDFDSNGKSRQEVFEKWQEVVQAKREKEVEDLKQKLEDNDKLTIDKMVQEIQKIDKDFDSNGKSRQEIFEKWKEIVQVKREKEVENLKKEFEDNDKLIIDKMVQEIQKIDKDFNANGKSRQEILNQWQDLTKNKYNDNKSV